MLCCLSTYLFLRERLHPGLLERIAAPDVDAVEIFAARQHFDYTDREHVQEIAEWFRSHTLVPWSLHAPLFPDREMGRAGAPAVNLLHPEKSRRINAMDEVKRALETAELIPFQNLIVDLGERGDSWSQRTLEHALTALEHLDAFAQPLGVRVLVENLTNEPTMPERLMEILTVGHLKRIGVCLDLGHAHMTVGIDDAIETLGSRICSVHVHDNHGIRDEHLWPGEGTINWKRAAAAVKALSSDPAIVLELDSGLFAAPDFSMDKVRASLALFG
uniref:Xylose isomerase-like TIM barrel n=1 Tax=mine drainage metagenome TaxID=410659 RepID=E6PXB5_9ZZZZ